MMFLSEAYGATKRIEEFLLLEERSQKSLPTAKASAPTSHDDVIISDSSPGTVLLSETEGSWNGTDPVIKDFSLSVNPGELIVITGAVGAGKSSLLTTLLDEVIVKTGKCKVTGKISYCPQESWIFMGTVRENILFGEPYDAKKYSDVVEAAALTRDFELFQKGDQTVIGDKGATLSGGQRARINFARKDSQLFID